MTVFERLCRITSAFGRRSYVYQGKTIREDHKGIDLVPTRYAGEAVPESAWRVREVTGGKVLHIKRDNARGLYVDIETAPDTFERYQHLQAVYVAAGQQVGQGTVIALAGSTGQGTGRHLHFGVYKGGAAEACAVDPSPWLGLPNKAGTYDGNNDMDEPTVTLYKATYGPVSAGDKQQVDALAQRQGVPVTWTEVQT